MSISTTGPATARHLPRLVPVEPEGLTVFRDQEFVAIWGHAR